MNSHGENLPGQPAAPSTSKASQAHFFPASAAAPPQSLLYEKFNARTATPESEALTSSDDDVDPRSRDHSRPIAPLSKSARRASWFNDGAQPIGIPRKPSLVGHTVSPTMSSNPNTPAIDSAIASSPWGPLSARGTAPAFSWGTAIWNAEKKDSAASRFSDVIPSPTSNPPPTSASLFSPQDSLFQQQTSPRDASSIPFPIPLYPTPKAYRSQSYSVGQQDSEPSPPTRNMTTGFLGRVRGSHSILQHRPSRPSMLSEVSGDMGLGKLNEVDDDDDSVAAVSNELSGIGPFSSSQLPSSSQTAEAKTIELLTMENAMLRQQQFQNRQLRPRSSTASAFGVSSGAFALHNDSVAEESDFAIDELDEPPEGFDNRHLTRRMSEMGVGGYRSGLSSDSKKQRGLWQSSFGFDLPDIPQSRRHSFADIPPLARNASTSSSLPTGAAGAGPVDSGDFSSASANSSSYYPIHNVGISQPHKPIVPPHLASSYNSQGFPNAYGSYSNRAASPHRLSFGIGQPRHNQLLFIVLFKFSRAEAFYVQEGTGLSIKTGDLVIVEADRGTDLGTVAHSNVSWQTAKELKEHYAEIHYKWLMMYSEDGGGVSAAEIEGLIRGLASHPSGSSGSGITGPHQMHEMTAGDLKPKLIKRLAQNHEIQSLQEKEASEAKARRICMQKVKEHGLNMEILDAEFQMDWKKLTFYYFADTYINFNSLVTDLFKIYKTRIWMSAVNPASFASPTLGPQGPAGINPGVALGGYRNAGTPERPTPFLFNGGPLHIMGNQPYPPHVTHPPLPYNASGPSPALVSAPTFVPGYAFATVNPNPRSVGEPHILRPQQTSPPLGPAIGSHGTWVDTFNGLSL